MKVTPKFFQGSVTQKMAFRVEFYGDSNHGYGREGGRVNPLLERRPGYEQSLARTSQSSAGAARLGAPVVSVWSADTRGGPTGASGSVRANGAGEPLLLPGVCQLSAPWVWMPSRAKPARATRPTGIPNRKVPDSARFPFGASAPVGSSLINDMGPRRGDLGLGPMSLRRPMVEIRIPRLASIPFKISCGGMEHSPRGFSSALERTELKSQTDNNPPARAARSLLPNRTGTTQPTVARLEAGRIIQVWTTLHLYSCSPL